METATNNKERYTMKKKNISNSEIDLSISVLEALGYEQELSILNSVPPAKKVNIIRAIGEINKNLNIVSGKVVCESYPKLKPPIAAKVILGIPVGEGLTHRERHEWLSEGAELEPIKWLLRGTGLEARTLSVARWLLKVLNNEEQKAALYKTRREGRLADHTIDLMPSDCEGGVNEAIARREDRMAVNEFGAEKLCEHPPWIKRLGGRVTVLDTAVALEREGREMSHCVGGYASNVKNGTSIIVSIKAWGHRATVEYNRSRKIVQMKSKANSDPSKLCKLLAKLAVGDG
jgi:hypothetical protein